METSCRYVNQNNAPWPVSTKHVYRRTETIYKETQKHIRKLQTHQTRNTSVGLSGRKKWEKTFVFC